MIFILFQIKIKIKKNGNEKEKKKEEANVSSNKSSKRQEAIAAIPENEKPQHQQISDNKRCPFYYYSASASNPDMRLSIIHISPKEKKIIAFSNYRDSVPSKKSVNKIKIIALFFQSNSIIFCSKLSENKNCIITKHKSMQLPE
ncbi:hypothetical protein RFI_32925, partial [Reticulomyxa filosa]